jgi:hypothetical protein
MLIGIAGERVVGGHYPEPTGVVAQRHQGRPLSAEPADCAIHCTHPIAVPGTQCGRKQRDVMAAEEVEDEAALGASRTSRRLGADRRCGSSHRRSGVSLRVAFSMASRGSSRLPSTSNAISYGGRSNAPTTCWRNKIVGEQLLLARGVLQAQLFADTLQQLLGHHRPMNQRPSSSQNLLRILVLLILLCRPSVFAQHGGQLVRHGGESAVARRHVWTWSLLDGVAASASLIMRSCSRSGTVWCSVQRMKVRGMLPIALPSPGRCRTRPMASRSSPGFRHSRPVSSVADLSESQQHACG